ncbi:MAG: hypothetical protein RH945_06255 [Hyphomonas sp.]
MIYAIENAAFNAANLTDIDLIISSSGYEERCRYIPSKLNNFAINAQATLAVVVLESREPSEQQKKNQEFFDQNGYTNLTTTSLERSNILETFYSLLSSNATHHRIVVDYSCMTRNLYAELIYFFNSLSESKKIRIDVNFCYAYGRYKSKIQPKIVKDYVLLPGYEGVGSQIKSKHCIYSLGFEGVLVESLHEWLEPSSQDFILANPGASQGSADRCYSINKDFIERNSGNLYQVAISDVPKLTRLIADKAKYLSETLDVIYVGLGPKPFVLAGLLAGLNNMNLANIYAMGRESVEVDVAPSGVILNTHVRFDYKY